MLPTPPHEDRAPLLVMLHWLGGSKHTWREVEDLLTARGIRCACLDLPGFGDNAESAPASIAETTESLIRAIRSLRTDPAEPWLLAGHSMGGKFAAILARASFDGESCLAGLRGLVLVSPSPPGVEPMTEHTRQKNLDSLGHSTQDAAKDRKHAEAFVDANIGKLPIDPAIRTRTADDILRMNRATFRAWLTSGSREDLSSFVACIPLPTLILAGTEESALGPDAQRKHTLPHFPNATLVPLVGCGHLAPLERPAEVALRILDFVETLGLPLAWPSLPADFRALIDSNRTSPQTRAVLLQRIADDTAPAPHILDDEHRLTLQAIAARIIPGCPFDPVPRIDRWLAQSSHDGWRHDELPPDLEAWQTGLHTLNQHALHRHDAPFVALHAATQDTILTEARDGHISRTLGSILHLTDSARTFTSAQMQQWFGDLHAELTRIYVADPRTMARIGFTGFADESGFTQIQLGEREDFERAEPAQ